MPPHDVLGVRPDAGRAEITEAFRRFALENHPDRGGDPVRFRCGLDAYLRLLDRRPSATIPPRADVVFHRRTRPGVPALLRLARSRLAAIRSHP